MSSVKTKFIFLLLICIRNCFVSQNDLVQIRPFGTNPGNLKLMLYDPGNITQKAPLVVVLHGCTQTAETCAEQTGWNKLAKQHGFYVLYPEQLILNNAENCFNWFRNADQSRDKGEPASIMQMIDYLKKNKQVDSTRIYIIGLSAGGAMSSVMMSVYPEVFDKGGVIGGGPYKSAESILNAGPAMLGMISKSPEDWGKLVKEQNPAYTGKYPELVIFHGGMDPVVSTNNANQLIKQWVNIHNTDYEEDEHFEQFRNNEDVELTIYKDSSKHEVVRYYRIRNMGHAIAIDTGNCPAQGGRRGLFAIQKRFHSTYWAAQFFGIIKPSYSISGPAVVKIREDNINYSVPFTEGSVYNWKTPAGMWVTGEIHNNTITVKVDHYGGILELTEIKKDGCMAGPVYLKIDVKE